MYFEHEAVIEADFNNLDADDRVVTSLRFLNSWRHPDVGEWVRLIDAEGNACIGQVEEVRNLIAVVRPDWTTWTSEVLTHPHESPLRVSFDRPETARVGTP